MAEGSEYAGSRARRGEEAERKRVRFEERVDSSYVCQGVQIRGDVDISQLLGIKNNCCWGEERKNDAE